MKHALIVVCAMLWFSMALSMTRFPLSPAGALKWEKNTVDMGDGSTIVFWKDTSDGRWGLKAQRFDVNGDAVWSEVLSIGSFGWETALLRTLKSSDGGVIIVWRADQDLYEGFVQKISGDGQMCWPDKGVLLFSEAASNMVSFELIPDADGGVYAYTTNHTNVVLGQHIDNTGRPRWGRTPRIVHSHGSMYAKLLQSVPDGAGGVVLNVLHWDYNVNNNNTNLLRLDSDGNRVGDFPLYNNALIGESVFSIQAGPQGSILIYKLNRFENYGLLNIHKMYPDGTLDTPSPHIIPLSDLSSRQLLIKVSSADEVYLLWACSGSQNRIMLLNSSLYPAWSFGEIVIPATDQYFDSVEAQPSPGSGLWVSWSPTPSSSHTQFQVQYVSINGVLAWQSTLQPSAILVHDLYLSVIPEASSARFYWVRYSGRSAHISYQRFNNNGTLQILPNAKQLVSRIQPKKTNLGLSALGDGFVSFWEEELNNVKKIMYQVIDADLKPVFPTYGRALMPDITQSQVCRKIVSAGNDVVGLMYTIPNGTGFTYYLQEVDSSGNALRDGYGMYLSEYTTSIDFYNGDYYTAWTEVLEGNYVIKGQRIHDGQYLWEAHGRILAVIPDGVPVVIDDVAGPHILYSTTGSSNMIYALRVEPDSAITPGWPPTGLAIEHTENQGRYSYGKAGMIGDKLGCIFSLIILSSHDIRWRLQVVTEDAQRLCGNLGIDLYIDNNSTSNSNFRAVFDDGVTTVSKSHRTPIINRVSIQEQSVTRTLQNFYYEYWDYVTNMAISRWDNGAYSVVLAYGTTHGMISHFLRRPDGSMNDLLNDAVMEGWEVYRGLHTAINGNTLLIANSEIQATSSIGVHNTLWATAYQMGTVATEDLLLIAPESAILHPNYPNPFNPSTTIRFEIAMSSPVKLAIYNTRGQLVKTLLDTDMPGGTHDLVWDGKDQQGRSVASGVYFYRMTLPNSVHSRKMLLIK